MNKTPLFFQKRSTPLGPAGGSRRATRVEIFGKKKGRLHRIHISPEPLACRYDGDTRTEVLRIGQRFVVESRNDSFRAKKTFQSEREALDFFNEEAV